MAIVVTILSILSTLLKPLADCLVDPFKDEVNYLCCYSCNVERLDQEVEELNVTKASVDLKVEAAKDGLPAIISPEVVLWLTKVEEVQTKSNRICSDAAQVQRSCLSKWFPFLHYSLSKDAKNTTEVSIELRNKKLEEIAIPINPANLEPVPITSEIGFKSRDYIEKQIMDALKNERVHLIGLCGMGGVGKTTMAKKIEKWARELTEDSRFIFEKVLMVIVSQQVDLPKIQQHIAEGLGFKFEQDSLTIRARLLHAKLKATNGVLIILDDVWERLNLEEVGIPSPSAHAGCKLMVTSRNRNAVTLREDAKNFSLEVLDDEESWILFRENAGNSIDSPHLYPLAKNVVKECKGLPLALATVGRALKDQTNSSWADALVELQNSKPRNIPDVLTYVYGPLQLSFRKLESEESRYLFLLCCLFPEDYSISFEELVRYGMGLGAFEVENLRQAKDRVENIVKNLIARSLLIESSNKWGNLCVKMHDVIRDMVIWFASKENSESKGKHVFMISHGKEDWPKAMDDSSGNYTCISLTFMESDFDVSECINCPKLEFLRLHIREYWSLLKMPENFFSGMRDLKILEASNINSLPSSIHLLNNLRTLHLNRCQIEMPSIIGKLMNLEILCLNHCEFEVLPVEIGGLKRLRKLDITHCSHLRRIVFGVLSGLEQMEELVILDSFNNWGAEEKDNASLVELNSLRHLTNLQIEIRDAKVIPKESPHWLQKLFKYSIAVSRSTLEISRSKVQKAIIVGDEVVTPLRHWFYDMTKDAEYLDLGGSNCTIILNMLAPLGYQNVKHLRLSKWNNVQYLSCVEGQQNGVIFPILKSLHIEESCNMKEISNGLLLAGSFKALEEISLSKMSKLMHLWTFRNERLCLSNLRNVYIDDCASLLYLFPLSIAESLSQLEDLKVSNCPIMEDVFKNEEMGMEITINRIEFPKLRKLTLANLQSLCGLCVEVDEIEVPTLCYLEIDDLPSIGGKCGHDICQQFLFDQQVSGNIELHILPQLRNFDRLKKLEVKSFHNFKSLFSPSTLSGFPNLEVLWVENCSMLEEVIGKEENMGETKTKRTLFPRLWSLVLKSLPKLLGFSHCMGDMNLPSLRSLTIEDCPVMETFVQEFSNESISITDTRPSYSQHIGQSFLSKEVFGLPNLWYVYIIECASLVYLFPLSIAESLSELKELEVLDCPVMKEVFKNKEEKGMEITIKKIEFPKLWRLNLTNLQSLCGFCIGVDAIEVPALWKLIINNLPNIMGEGGHDIHQQFPFNKQVVGNNLELHIPTFAQLSNFNGLEWFEVESIHNFKSLFPPSILNGFPNLKVLSVKDCSMLEEVIGKEENIEETKTKRTSILPQLVNIVLARLPKLLTFCHMMGGVELPSLERVHIDDCPMLERFSLGTLNLPKFENLLGVSDPNFGSKFFFNKEKSSHETHLENNCFTISARDLSFLPEDSSYQGLSPDSSDCFVAAARVYGLREIKGELEAIKLSIGVVYEIILMIKIPKHERERSVNFELTLPGGIIQHHTETLYHMPRSEWNEILVGEFTREPDQIGQLEFSFCLENEPYEIFIKGFTIRMKA